jgi:hypothetical protein
MASMSVKSPGNWKMESGNWILENGKWRIGNKRSRGDDLPFSNFPFSCKPFDPAPRKLLY